MALEKIKESDLEGKGVIGQAEVPGLPAAEMQAKIEEIVRAVAIPKINEVIEYIAGKVATQEDLEKLLIEAGAVTSVFGRAGKVKAQKGDYNAEMVGAAAKKHSAEHAANGSDPIKAADIGAAEKTHAHGNITSDGKIGSTNGMFVVTGTGGKLETKAKNDCGFLLPQTQKSWAGTVTAENNVLYIGEGISKFAFTCDTAKTASCHGWVTFGTPGTISLKNFAFVDDPDGISSAKAGSRWEFDLERGCLIIRKRST